MHEKFQNKLPPVKSSLFPFLPALISAASLQFQLGLHAGFASSSAISNLRSFSAFSAANLLTLASCPFLLLFNKQ
jgi:hypothetical protein